ncbi:hypothetical protein [Thermoactinomyces sp. DSM 45892]|uniref:hypothetical protein n=1 Tax=Thermoactinomyces sp. DSM 45892 TaxID=1882753 RepID=UPI0008983E0F|nr:hypothetical protein [Thermoactinomyces sp. DSM 45892]SDX93450.1 hypothetical protein SAMN05444416_10145 [Thermoactinomyces sp. DSM 45892]
MKTILAKILENDKLVEYPLFKEFCFLKAKGLRKQSFKELELFIDEARNWDQRNQQDFVIWLFGLIEEFKIVGLFNVYDVLVYQLDENLLKPVLNEWMKLIPQDPRPYRWYGLFLRRNNCIDLDVSMTYLHKAIEVGGNNEQRAISRLIDIHFDSLWYSFHHISEDLYLGSNEKDIDLMREIQELNGRVECEQTKNTNYLDLIYYKKLLDDWNLFRKDQSRGFVEWCEARGREYSFVKAYYYNKD